MKIGATKKTRKKTTSKVSKVKNKNISKLFEFWKHHQLFVYTYLTSCTSWTSSSTDFKESCEHWDENMVCNLLFSFWRLITTFSISWSRSSISNLSNFNLEKSSSNHIPFFEFGNSENPLTYLSRSNSSSMLNFGTRSRSEELNSESEFSSLSSLRRTIVGRFVVCGNASQQTDIWSAVKNYQKTKIH